MLCQEAAYSAPYEGPLTAGILKDSIEETSKDPSIFQVPNHFSFLKDIHTGQAGKPLIIHIQDAHSNLSGQENLSKTVDEIIKRYQIRLVLVEGGATDGTLDTLKTLAPAPNIQQTAKKLLMEGKLAGEEYLNLVSDHKMKIQGIEDMALYQESVESYSKLCKKRERILEYLEDIQNALEKLKGKLYPAELLKYERDRKKDSLALNFKALCFLAEDKQINLSPFPAIQALKAVQEKETKIDFNLANLEQAMLIKDKDLPAEKYPNLLKHREYLKEFSAIDLNQIQEEWEMLEDRVYLEISSGNADALLIRAIDRYLGVLSAAYRIQMTTKDFDFFKANQPDFSTISYQAFVNRKLMELEYFDDVIAYQNILEDGRKALEDFYESVNQRDFAFMKNIEKIMENGLATEKADSLPKAALLITGGYHTRHLEALMKDKGYSYIVLAPIVTEKTNQQKYESLLLSEVRKEGKKVEVSTVRMAGAVMNEYRIHQTVARYCQMLWSEFLALRILPASF